MTVRFDDSLPALVDAIVGALGERALTDGLVLRDASGQLTFFTAQEPAEPEALTATLVAALGPYARPGRPHAPLPPELADEPTVTTPRVGGRFVRVLDRRIVGADWQRTPGDEAPPPPRFVFASVKGGVGRSTSLAVVGIALADGGRRVLAIDLDLEAPGLGATLLDEHTTPPLGVLDALVEDGLSPLDDETLRDLIGASPLVTGAGRLDVAPAFGARCLAHPENTLGKLARAYLDDMSDDGTSLSLLDQTRRLVDHLVAAGDYDIVLIDARAGLHEASAAAILGLGAEVLLFGLDEPQTFMGYRALLAHLKGLTPAEGPPPRWLERLTPVQAKAPANDALRERFSTRWQEIITDLALFEPPTAPTATRQGQGPLTWDETATDDEVIPEQPSLRSPIAVLFDSGFLGFDPLRDRGLTSSRLTAEVFRELLVRAWRAVGEDHK